MPHDIGVLHINHPWAEVVYIHETSANLARFPNPTHGLVWKKALLKGLALPTDLTERELSMLLKSQCQQKGKQSDCLSVGLKPAAFTKFGVLQGNGIIRRKTNEGGNADLV